MSQVIDPEAEPLEAIVVGDGPVHTAVVVATWLGVALVVVVAIWFAWTQVINPSGGSVVERYVDGEGHLYESLRDQFRAEFPTKPSRQVLRGPLGEIAVVTSRPGPDYQFTVIHEPQPETALENYGPTLNTAAGSLANQVGGEIVSQTPPLPLAINNVAVKDVVFRKGDDYYRNRLILARDRLYTVQAKVKGDDKAPFTELAKTFQVLGPR
jgi:hypothetical protein